ncbi:MAG: hypothetical protein ACLVGL_02340 [Waltera sp.]
MNIGRDAVVIMGCDTEGSAAAIEELGAAGVPVLNAVIEQPTPVKKDRLLLYICSWRSS